MTGPPSKRRRGHRRGCWKCAVATTHNLHDVDVDIPLGVLVVVTGVAGSGKSSLIHGSVSGRDGVVSVDQAAIKGSRAEQPATYTGLLDPIRKAFAKANGVKPGSVQRQLRGRLPQLQRCRRHLHRLGDDGRCRDRVRGVRREALPGRGARVHLRRQGHQRGARDVGGRGGEVLRRRRGAHARCTQDPRPSGRRRARLPRSRPAAHAAVRRRAAAPQAGHPRRREGATSYVLGRADLGSPPRRRRAAARSARPARRLRQVGHRHRAPPRRVMAHADWILDLGPGAPDTTAAGSSFEGTPRRPRRGPLDPHRRAPRGLTSAPDRDGGQKRPARNASTSAANSSWCWNRNPWAASG